MKGPIPTLANSTVYPIDGHFCENHHGSKFLKLEVASPQILEEVDFSYDPLGILGTEPQFGTHPPPPDVDLWEGISPGLAGQFDPVAFLQMVRRSWLPSTGL